MSSRRELNEREFVELARFPNVFEAQLALNLLEDEEIDAFLDGESMATMGWHLNVATGGVRLFVDKGEEERALELLRQIEDQPGMDEPYEDEHLQEAAIDETEADVEEESEEEPEDVLRRAWRAAILGPFLFPPLLTLYSIFLLLCVPQAFEKPHPLRKKALTAAVVNVLAILWCMLVGWMIGSSLSRSVGPPDYGENGERPIVEYREVHWP